MIIWISLTVACFFLAGLSFYLTATINNNTAFTFFLLGILSGSLGAAIGVALLLYKWAGG